jgi:hypothetical protein
MTHVSQEGNMTDHFRDDYQRVESGPLYPSAVFHVKTQWVVHGWPKHYPNVIREVQWYVVQLSDPVYAIT